MAFSATPSHLYSELGLDATRVGAAPPDLTRGLYLDMVKRAVCNLLYEDISLWSYDHNKVFHPLNRFDLKMRLSGEDMPTQAHTMVGWHRLTNIEQLARDVIEAQVPGDFVETGVLRGGASIFMRAVLKAYGVTDRRIFACDTFVAPTPETRWPPRWFKKAIFKVVSWLTRIPSEKWQLKLYRMIEALQKSFPKSANPSREMIELMMQMVRYIEKNQGLLAPQDSVSLDAVKSHFARYGLLDSQVVFLQGFFSETLPQADIHGVAVLRLDGDSYESTRSVLDAMYAKVSPGGYVIIDDYHTFSDCRRAVDEFREALKIESPLIPIDRIAAYWQKH